MINVNGTDYYTKDELASELPVTEHVIVICKYGWIFEGRMAEAYRLTDAHVVRKWANGRGIGGLQKAEYRDEYALDPLPSGIELASQAVLAVLPIEEW